MTGKPMKEPSLRQLKADLAAANQEVRQVMNENIVLKKEAAEAYQSGYRDALQATDNLARINQTQAGMITYFMGIITGGLNPRQPNH